MSQEALVSVVVPVYNVEPYIGKCLASLCRQTYHNIEIVVVDDGSLDNSVEIIHDFMERDSRIRYLKRINGGLGAARNTGIENSQGEYICFVDSDDWVSEDYVEKFVSTSMEDESDVVISNIRYVYEDDSIKPRTPHIDSHEIITAREALSREFIGAQYKCHAPNKFCKREIFMKYNIRFPDGKLYEDVFTTYKMLMYASKVSLIPDFTYFYLQSRSGSIMNTKLEMRRFTDIFEALDLIIRNPVLGSYHLDDEIQALYIANVISLVNYIYPLCGVESKKEIIKYREAISRDTNYKVLCQNILKNRKIDMITKVRILGIKYIFFTYCYLLRWLKTL